MKYVAFRLPQGDKAAVLFPDFVIHSSVRIRGAQPTGAGFVRYSSRGQPFPYGRSESLDLDPAPDDDRLLPDLGWYVGLLKARQLWRIPTLHIRPEVRDGNLVWCAWVEAPVLGQDGRPIESSHEEEVVVRLLQDAPRPQSTP